MRADFNIHKIKVIKKLNESTCWIEFGDSPEAEPGQFVMVWLPGVGEKPYSIASIDPFCLLVVDVGPFSHALSKLSPDDRVWIKGPLGQGFSLKGRAPLLVGGGYGVAPLFALTKLAKKSDIQVHTCLGAAKNSGLLLVDEFLTLGCKVSLTTEDGSQGEKGWVTQVVEKALQGGVYDTVYACGPVGMLSALAGLCKKLGVDYQLSWEAHMRCGMGLCGSCEVPQVYDPALPEGWLACFDGPVFQYCHSGH